MIMYLGVDKVERRNFNKGIFFNADSNNLFRVYESSEINRQTLNSTGHSNISTYFKIKHCNISNLHSNRILTK